MGHRYRVCIAWIASLVVAGCSMLPSPAQRYEHADQLALAKGWQHAQWRAGGFQIALWMAPVTPSPARLSIYIEGDGLAWVSPSQPSDDPTPIDPVALRLALAQPTGRAVYVARPCQYGDASSHSGASGASGAPSASDASSASNGSSTSDASSASNDSSTSDASGASGLSCGRMYWTTHRFSPAVVESIDQIVSRLKQRSGAEHLTLIGYSGGGAIAALVAARRHDVDRLITVAGNLEPREWVREKGLQPLEGSLDPSDDIQALGAIRQWHFVGGRDTTVPPHLTEDFADRFAPSMKPKVIAIDDFGHACCWADHWSELWTTYGLGAANEAP